MSTGPEYTQVESPFLEQLRALGWKIVTGSTDFASATGRDSFRDVLLKDDLRAALTRINLRDGEPWLDASRVNEALSALERRGAKRLMEANQEATELLHGGVDVEGLPDWDQGRLRRIHYVDWNQPENNTFTAVNQFRVRCPRGQARPHFTPDIVLFVNGLPVVVVECKARGISEPLPEAVDQLRRYHNQRRPDGEVEVDEGNEQLFHTVQVLVVTCFDEARAGTVGADFKHYMEWKDTAPVPLDDVRAELNKEKLSSQHRLVAGLLRPAHLVDVIRHFTLFKTDDAGKSVKILTRYQQFRAVHYAVERLLHGKTREQDGEHDRRGGIVWHTQGSGKSLTMVFLVRKMRSLRRLRRFKVVVVTDRKNLQRQLSETARLTGETVLVARNVAQVKKALRVKGPGLVFVMIQKYGDLEGGRFQKSRSGKRQLRSLGLLNDDESIVVLVDEAHRSHGNRFHAHLREALPNSARIGFTGTPILMGDKKRTHSIFGEFIDRYTLRESEADGATVPILYEGRTAEAAVADGRDLDQFFEDMFHEKSPEELERIQRKYGTQGAILEAKELIQAKARDMLRHYVENVLPSGLKAQVVAYSRRAAVRYQEAFVYAQDDLIREARRLDPATRELDDLALQKKPRKLLERVDAVADRLMELARANRDRLESS